MQQSSLELAQLVVDNRQALGEAYKRKMVGGDQLALSALTWALAGKQVDVDAVRESIAYLREQSGAFSAERGGNEEALVAYMAMSGDKAAYLAKVRAVFAKVMEGKKVGNDSRFGEAMIIANNADDESEAIRLAERAEELFGRMRETHPVITSDRDRSFAALLAMADRDVEALLADAEECYQLLGKGYKMSEGRQTMANILSLSPAAPADKVARVRELREAFKANKVSIGWTTSQEFAVLALLANDDRPAAEIGADVADIIAFLKKQKGFGALALASGATRVVLASVISSFAHAAARQTDAVANAVSMAVAQAIMDWIVIIIVVVM